LKREYYFALRPGQRVECPRCGNMLEVGEDSSVYCDYCGRLWWLCELLDYVNGGETRVSNLADETRMSTNHSTWGGSGPKPKIGGNPRPHQPERCDSPT
jgi:ribosomal protein S27E